MNFLATSMPSFGDYVLGALFLGTIASAFASAAMFAFLDDTTFLPLKKIVLWSLVAYLGVMCLVSGGMALIYHAYWVDYLRSIPK